MYNKQIIKQYSQFSLVKLREIRKTLTDPSFLIPQLLKEN